MFKGAATQKGLVLLLMLIGIMMVFGAYALTGLSINHVKTEQRKQTQTLLKNAKVALMAHTLTHMDQVGGEGEMGYLSCPYQTGTTEGGSDGNCDIKKVNTFGYYPWRSVETDVLTDNSGSCLRYIVSGSYKNSPHSGMINEDTSGQLQVVDSTGSVVAGSTPEDRVVAIIAAPGEPLTGQNRSIDATSFCGKDYANMGAYLEGNGVTDNGALTGVDDYLDQFIHATDSSASEAVPYNDKFVTITSNEIWEKITSRPDFLPKMQALTKSIAECVARYALTNAGNKLPWAAPMALTDYRVNNNYDDDDGTGGYYAGRLPFLADSSNTTIKIGGVNELFDQGNCDLLGGFSVDLKTQGADGYRKLYDNWKDHIFYVLSKNFEPADMAALTSAVDAAKAAAVAAVAARVATSDTANTAAIVVGIATDAVNAIAGADVTVANIASSSASIMATAAAANATNATTAATNASNAATAATAAALLVTDPSVAAAVNLAAIAAMGAATAANNSATAANDTAVAAGNIVNAVTTFDSTAASSAVNDALVAQADAATAESAAITAANDALLAADTADSAAASSCTPGNCILVNGVARAGLVIYAGSRQAGQIRREPLITGPTTTDDNTKDQISNYIESGNDAIFPDVTGNGSYAPVGAGGNDIMYCINVDMSVDACL